jgi:hypothetical protein
LAEEIRGSTESEVRERRPTPLTSRSHRLLAAASEYFRVHYCSDLLHLG